jgi:hypothetical protein
MARITDADVEGLGAAVMIAQTDDTIYNGVLQDDLLLLWTQTGNAMHVGRIGDAAACLSVRATDVTVRRDIVAESNLLYRSEAGLLVDAREQLVGASNTSVFASNTSFLALAGATFASNAAVFASNTGVSGAFASNTSVLALGGASFASNASVLALGGASFASNTGAFGSNIGAFASNTGAFGSNTSVFASNVGALAFDAGTFASNTGVYASNMGAYASNAVGIAAERRWRWTANHASNQVVQASDTYHLWHAPDGSGQLVPHIDVANTGLHCVNVFWSNDTSTHDMGYAYVLERRCARNGFATIGYTSNAGDAVITMDCQAGDQLLVRTSAASAASLPQTFYAQSTLKLETVSRM